MIALRRRNVNQRRVIGGAVGSRISWRGRRIVRRGFGIDAVSVRMFGCDTMSRKASRRGRREKDISCGELPRCTG